MKSENTQRGFASDNNSGIHPDILEAIISVNNGHAAGYGDDPVTAGAVSLFKREFGDDVDVYFVFNGTGANVLALSGLTHSFHSVICAATAHIQEDECGAPEKFTGCKLIPVETIDGKLRPEAIRKHLRGFGFPHHSQPGVISISQVTELGTVYSVEEIKAIAALAHEHGMFVHMDGARLANAAVSLDIPFRAFTRDAGVDVLSFGGTKNGMMMGEAVIFFNKDNSRNIKFMRKQLTHLYSKMRFLSAQFIAYLSNDLWKRNAGHANRMAALLEQELSATEGVRITRKTEANGVFIVFPRAIIPALRKQYSFYVWDETSGESRLMTSFDTTEDDVRAFAETVRSLITQPSL